MDSQCFAYGSYSPYSNASSTIPTRIIKSLAFDSRNSPHFHFYNNYATDHILCNNGWDQISSTDNLSESTFSSNSSLDYSPYFHPSPLQHTPFLPENVEYGDHHIRRALEELETTLMAVDDDEEVITSQPSSGDALPLQSRAGSREARFPHPTSSPMPVLASPTPPADLKQLLIACAEALSEDKFVEFEKLVEHARASVSITGEPIQRLGAYMIEGLIARRESSGTNIYRALKCNEPESKDLLSYMHTLYEVCPYLKFSYMAANGAIAEACKNEDRIHIIDFQIAQGTQWITLLQALAERPKGAPRVRITGVDDPVSRFARGASLSSLGRRFEEISKRFNISLEFRPIDSVSAIGITKEMLDVRDGEALAVNFPLQLHHTPDESVDVSNPRDGLLRMVKSLSPKVVTLVEQESNTNTAPFLPRFIETLDYYSAMFESLDVATSRESKDRINVEKHCLARDIVNVIACEGKERVERHELLGKWRSRFSMAGFEQCKLSSYVNSVIGGLLKCYSENYRLVEKDGAMLLGWKNRNLISASAWH